MSRAGIVAGMAGVALLGAGSMGGAPGPCPGDLNGGGKATDATDLAILLGAYGNNAQGDVDGDGVTDQQDLGILLADFGCPQTVDYDGTISHDLVVVDNSAGVGDPSHPEFDPGVSHHTFDLTVAVTGTEGWTSGEVQAELANVNDTFFQHATLDSDVPQSGLWGAVAVLQFDSFWSGPTSPPSIGSGAAIAVTNSGQEASATWFALPVAQTSGTIARYTIITSFGLPPEVREAGFQGFGYRLVGTVRGNLTAGGSGGTLIPVAYDIVQPPMCPGDINGFGGKATDSADLSVMIGNFGMTVPPFTQGDLNGDGVIDSADLSIIISDWGCGL